MRSLITLKHVQVENANAIAGVTWGFPAISNFLGFKHAISRKLKHYADLSLGSCAVVCHRHDVQAYQPGDRGDYVFSLTRNPLTKEEKSPSFVEEGRMHMDVTLIIECDFKHTQLDFDLEYDDDEAQVRHLIDWLYQTAIMQRLAGGTIKAIQSIEFDPVPTQADELAVFTRRKLMRLLPGYLLVDRNDLLRNHHQEQVLIDQEASLLDSWLDFVAIKSRSIKNKLDGEYELANQDDEVPQSDEGKAIWERLPKPASGWLVPITTGYTAISPLYKAGEVKRTRDSTTPFRFVESVYSIGQWISPHRITDMRSVLWHYQQKGSSYLCVNNFVQQPQSSTESAGSE